MSDNSANSANNSDEKKTITPDPPIVERINNPKPLGIGIRLKDILIVGATTGEILCVCRAFVYD